MSDSDRQLDLKVKALPNETYDIQVAPQSTVKELKKLLEEKTQMPEARQRLIYRGRVLEDTTTLEQNALESGHTIHLVERNPDAPPQQHPPTEPTPPRTTSTGTTRISVNLGPGAPRELHDIGRVVQRVLDAVGVQTGNAPAPASAPTGEGQRFEFSERVPHLMLAMGNYLSRLEQGQLQTLLVPLISLAPRAAERTANQGNVSALTGALCEILTNARLSPELQQQLQTARDALNAPDGSVEAQGSAQSETGSASTGQRGAPYPHLPLLTAGFTDMVRRAEVLMREKAARSLANAVRQLENTAEIDETNLEILIGCIRQVGSISNWYGALLAELGRIASAMVSALRGDVMGLAINTPATLSLLGDAPNFPPFFPQGLRDLRQATNPRAAATRQEEQGQVAPQTEPTGQSLVHLSAVLMGLPETGGTEAGPQPVEFSFQASGELGGSELANQAAPFIEQLTRALTENNSIVDGITSALGLNQQQQATQEPAQGQTTAPATQTGAPTQATGTESASTEALVPQPPPAAAQSSTTSRTAPAGMRGGLCARPRPQSTPTQQSTTATQNQSQTATTREASAQQPTQGQQSQPQGMEALMNSVASLVGGGGGGGGLEGMVSGIASNLANNPNMRRLVETPAVQNLASSAIDPETGRPNFGRLMNEMGPLMMSLLDERQPSETPQSRSTGGALDLADLPPERAVVWRVTIENDLRRMEAQTVYPALSWAYLAGRVTRGSSQSILPRDSEFD